MDKETLSLLERAISGSITSNLWIVLLGSAVAGAIGAFFGTLLKGIAEQLALRAGFKQLLEQLEQQTRITKSIEAELQQGVNTHSERFKTEFAIYRELLGLLTDFKRLGTAVFKIERTQAEKPTRQLLDAYDQSAEDLSLCLERNMPFYADDVRFELLEIQAELASAIEKSRGLPPLIVTQFAGVELKGRSVEGARAIILLNKAWEVLKKDKLERICNLVRQRIGFR